MAKTAALDPSLRPLTEPSAQEAAVLANIVKNQGLESCYHRFDRGTAYGPLSILFVEAAHTGNDRKQQSSQKNMQIPVTSQAWELAQDSSQRRGSVPLPPFPECNPSMVKIAGRLNFKLQLERLEVGFLAAFKLARTFTKGFFWRQ